MLFLGSEKYPLEDEYVKFIADNAGITNAYTALEATNYYFGINPGQLAGALDR